MATQKIPVYTAPFQGGTNGTDITTVVDGIITTVTSPEISFVNDGYTVLIVKKGTTEDVNIYIPSVPDNAGRIKNIGAFDVVTGLPTAAAQVIRSTSRLYGPFRPIWWNFGGTITVSFNLITRLDVAAIRLEF